MISKLFNWLTKPCYEDCVDLASAENLRDVSRRIHEAMAARASCEESPGVETQSCRSADESKSGSESSSEV